MCEFTPYLSDRKTVSSVLLRCRLSPRILDVALRAGLWSYDIFIFGRGGCKEKERVGCSWVVLVHFVSSAMARRECSAPSTMLCPDRAVWYDMSALDATVLLLEEFLL